MTVALSKRLAGRFIVLEGIDGSGTTTQVQRLGQRLEAGGLRPVVTFEPSPSPLGQLIRHALSRAVCEQEGARQPAELALLFAANRLEHLRTVVEPALADGQIVICDRYVMSSWAYQSLDCPLDWVQEINSHARWPDATLVLNLPAESAAERVAARSDRGQTEDEIFDNIDLQRRLADSYVRFAEAPGRSQPAAASGSVRLVDASGDPNSVESAIWSALQEILG